MKPTICAHRYCGNPIEQAPTGRPKRFCSSTCRVNEHRAVKRDNAPVVRPVVVEVVGEDAYDALHDVASRWAAANGKDQSNAVPAFLLHCGKLAAEQLIGTQLELTDQVS